MIIHMVNRDDVSKQLRTNVKLPDIDMCCLCSTLYCLLMCTEVKVFYDANHVPQYMQRISSICRTTLSCVFLAVCLKGLMLNSTFSYYHNLDF